jgi:hypothetical protein
MGALLLHLQEPTIFDTHMSVHRNILPNYSQQDKRFLNLFIFTDVLHVSGGSSAHHQEHIITYSFRYCQQILLLAAIAEETLHLVGCNLELAYSLSPASFLLLGGFHDMKARIVLVWFLATCV